MKFIWIFIIIFSVSLCAENTALKFDSKDGNVKELKDSFFGRDKGYHFLGSLMSTILIAKSSEDIYDYKLPKQKQAGMAITLSLGISKELIDSTKKNNMFSWKDLAADLLGIAAAILILDIK